ncbi:hypothetical protein Acid7E03_00660 [Acidisoma sp. 7E03]
MPATGASGPDAAALSALLSQTNTPLAQTLDGPSPLIVAHEPLNGELLERFYARHQFEPVWQKHPAQADALVAMVLQAESQGLDPDLFHAKLLRRRASLSPVDRDLVLSDAFLAYAQALAQGAVPVALRDGDQVLAPAPVDVTATLDEALSSDHPAAVVAALAPKTPTYKALLAALAADRAGTPPPAGGSVRSIVVNLERQRWLPRTLPPTRVWVNVADQHLTFYRANQPVFVTRVVVGEDIKINQSPEFNATIQSAFYNPPWVIPSDIAAKEILPKTEHDPDYLERNHMVALANGEVEQLPGPDAGLGLIMFDMPNRFDVYLHDTPDREIFNESNRQLSHGCIRVQNPRELASLLLDTPLSAVDDGIAQGGTTQHDLPKPVPVYVVYQTAFVDPTGTLQFRPDFYHRDQAIWQALHRGPSAPNPHADVLAQK